MIPAAVFLSMAVLWTYPLVLHLGNSLLGRGTGDNVTSLWNFWWMRKALASDLSPFRTPYLFAPVGADLTLNTHTALPAFMGATVLSGVPIVTAHNLSLLATVMLNGCCAYALGWRITRDHGAAIITGLIFAGSPYVAAHLHGHFNLVSAWTIPLLAIAGVELVGGSLAWAALAGLVIGVTAYLDYYYVLYGSVLVLCLVVLAARDWRVVRGRRSARVARLALAVGALAVVALVTAIAIAVTGGFSTSLGSIRISARDTFNPLQAFWILVAIYVWLRWRIRLRAAPGEQISPSRAGRALLMMLAAFLATAAPLVWSAIGLVGRGEYGTQSHFWRSSPKGVDVGTLLLGNPFHSLWGGGVQRMYGWFGVDVIESTAWLGVAPLALAIWIVRRHWSLSSGSLSERIRSHLVRQWVFVGLVFFIVALGPHLMAFGTSTAMILPQAFIRYIPLVDNARIPGRAMVVVYLSLAILSGLAVAEWRSRSRYPVGALIAVAALVIVDYLPVPFPLVPLNRPAVYETLCDRPEQGAVLELPLGIRDGFGSRGKFDERVLFYQTIHERPLVGGFAARLPTSIAKAYEADPLITALLRLSAGEIGGALPTEEVATARLRANGIRWVVLERGAAPKSLLDYVDRALPLVPVARDGQRQLYLIDPID